MYKEIAPLTLPENLADATAYFRRAAYDIQNGEYRTMDLVSRSIDNIKGTDHYTTGLAAVYGNPRGADLSESAIKKSLPPFINELTGKDGSDGNPWDGWNILSAIADTEIPAIMVHESSYSASYWELQTLHENVLIGLKRIWDDHGVWSESWYLTSVPAQERELPLGRRLAGKIATIFRSFRIPRTDGY